MPLSIDANALTIEELSELIHQRSCEVDAFREDTKELIRIRAAKEAQAPCANPSAPAQVLGPAGIPSPAKVGQI